MVQPIDFNSILGPVGANVGDKLALSVVVKFRAGMDDLTCLQ